MPRPAVATLCSLLASCAVWFVGCTVGESRGVGASTAAFGRDQSLVAPLPTPRDAAAGAPSEAELRTQLATDLDPTDAALELVRLLETEEHLDEALAVLDTALARASAAGDADGLRVARAGVLRDLGRRAEALAELQALRQQDDGAPLHPGLLYEVFELLWLQGDVGGAGAVLAELRDARAGTQFVADHRDELAAAAERLEQGLPPARRKVRDLLGDLRGAVEVVDRQRALQTLLAAGGSVAEQAALTALGDRDPEIRRVGVDRAAVAPSALAEFCAMALSDPALVVRLAGAQRALALPTEEAVGLLLPTLAAEHDAAAFAEFNDLLRRATGDGRTWTAAEVADDATRTAVVAEWRRSWER